jgi:hypothetical protein
MEARQESDESEQLQGDQDNEKEEIESFVLKHAAERARTKQPTGPQLNPSFPQSHHNACAANHNF